MMAFHRIARLAFLAGLAMTLPAAAQQTVPFRNNIPVAPSGIPVVELPSKAMLYETAEGQTIRVVVVARGMANPWSLVFLPNGDMLITERPGRVRLLRKGTLDPTPVAGAPMVRAGGLGGLMEITLHPQFATNNLVYLSYAKPVGTEQATVLAVARGRWSGNAFVDMKDVFVANDGTNGPARMTFGRDGTLYITTGGVNTNVAQEGDKLAGKVLRLRDDGSIPPDNPFVGKPGFRPEVFTLGHRSSLGLGVHPGTGQIWQHENGPNGGDEINILKPGGNYGWPLISYGRTYPGPRQSEIPWKDGFEQPFVSWIPSIAASGLMFYTGNRLPKWKGDVFVGALRVGEVPGTGHLQRILFNEKMEELRRESLLVDLRQRVRDIRQGPDELIYVLTDHPKDGALLRIEPTN